ncbi:unnamed protein product [Linum trigynum]|uniref:DYW domain-containing protein n=1 Tax=Linum trigynum TaxID=586398 RepID=A0AAV2F8Y9_9ROSI
MATWHVPLTAEALLNGCRSSEELEQIQAHMLKTGLVLNTFKWNTVIRRYANSNEPEAALILYTQMQTQSVPRNTHTFPFLLKACSNLSAFEETRQIHGQVIKLGFGSQVHATNAILHAYTSSGGVNYGRHLFNLSTNLHDTVTWNTMINGYMKCGEIKKATELFKMMPTKNAISWTVMVSGYVQAGFDMEALEVFQKMQAADMKLDSLVLTSALSACSHLGALDQGRWIHEHINRSGMKIDSMLGCALIDMYAKCGNMGKALEIFEKVGNKSVHAWTAMIFGCAIHGQGREAFSWFKKMKAEGITPNQVTFTAILTACSNAGMVEEAKSMFKSIIKNGHEGHTSSPTIEHYGCMVDVLGRAGLLMEAIDLIKRMPVEPNAIIWGSLLKSCKIHGNLELGKEIGKLVIEMNPDHGGRYIHLANIHAAAREWKLAAETRRKMKAGGVSKLPGCSTISVNGIVHEFVAGDRNHPEADAISSIWHQIADRLKQEGYKPVTTGLLLDLEDNEKETAISQHSEKLATAFALIHTKPGTGIRIFKNLRVCEDCHAVMKLISKIYNREIVMRDRTRFHCFRDGKCSCADYW